MNRDKFIVILLLVFSALVVYHSDYWNGNGRAGGHTTTAPLRGLQSANAEEEFLNPIDVVWRGEIISTMTSGSCIGLKGKFDNYLWAMACLEDADSNELWKFQGMVTVTGKWLGITCAYQNTIFGQCVPDVRIESIETDMDNKP